MIYVLGGMVMIKSWFLILDMLLSILKVVFSGVRLLL